MGYIATIDRRIEKEGVKMIRDGYVKRLDVIDGNRSMDVFLGCSMHFESMQN